MCLCEFFIKFGDLLPKLIENLLAGLILLWIGFAFFKRQQKFLASAREVHDRCKDLEIFLKPFIDLNYQLELFEDLIRNMYRSGLSDFVNRYSKVSVMDNTTFVNNLRSYPLTDDTTKPIPESLTRTIELQKPLTAVIHFRVATLTARGIFLETLHKLNQKDPSLDINSLSNIWNEYLKCRRSYFQIIKILETIAHNSIHEAYDWNEFVSQLSKIELD